MSSQRRAFTLVEILVVLAVIVLLVALLLPSLNQAKLAARRVRCASNLRQFGIGLSNYAVDSKSRLLETTYDYAPYGGARLPFWWRCNVKTLSSAFNPYNLYSISLLSVYPYIPGIRFTDPVQFKHGFISGIWLCPEMSSPYPTDFPQGSSQTHRLQSPYSYFARFENFSNRVTHPGDVTAGELRPDRLLMADTTWYYDDGVRPKWIVNHQAVETNTELDYGLTGGPKNWVGSNQLYGDGAVLWLSATNVNPAQYLSSWTPTNNDTVGYVHNRPNNLADIFVFVRRK